MFGFFWGKKSQVGGRFKKSLDLYFVHYLYRLDRTKSEKTNTCLFYICCGRMPTNNPINLRVILIIYEANVEDAISKRKCCTLPTLDNILAIYIFDKNFGVL